MNPICPSYSRAKTSPFCIFQARRCGFETMSTTGTQGALVGLTPGNGALDPGGVDISSTGTVPIITVPDLFRPDLALAADRPVIGTTTDLTTDNIPAGSLLGALRWRGSQRKPSPRGLLRRRLCHSSGGFDGDHRAGATRQAPAGCEPRLNRAAERPLTERTTGLGFPLPSQL